jgi:hypothetical protein
VSGVAVRTTDGDVAGCAEDASELASPGHPDFVPIPGQTDNQGARVIASDDPRLKEK